MAWLDIVATASTVLFRVAVYLYLRVLPARFAKFILPPLFVISTAANVLVQKQLPQVDTQSNSPPLADAGVVVKTESVESPAPPTAENTKPDSKHRITHTAPPASSPLWKTTPRRVLDLVSGTNVRKSGLNILGNALLFLAAADFTAHPFIYQYEDVVFARVGAVTHNSAKIQARYPGLETNSSRIRYRSAAGSAAWKDGPLLTFDDSHDFVAVGKLTGLYPSTHYEYILAYPNATQLPYPASPLQFRTFPDTSLTSASGTHFKFLVSSCAMPNFPYMPFSGTRVKGFDYVASFLGSNGFESRDLATHSEPAEPVEEAAPSLDIDAITPESDATSTTPTTTAVITPTTEASGTPAPFIPTEFMLFLGDFIYADVPWGVQTLSHYRSLYRRMFASPSVRKVYERLPIFTIYDDHEFENNFAGSSNETKAPWTNASTAYHDYLGAANHDIRGGHSYYEFRYGDSAFFVLDTRKHRSDETVDPEERTILGDAQLAALHNWLARVNGTAVWKFVISSVPLSTLWAYDAKEDSWAAFDKERQSVLSALTSVDNVIVLTGDRHQYAVIDFFGGRLLEISTSPLSQFDLAFKGIPALGRWSSEETFNRTVVALNATDGLEYQTTVQTPVERILEYIPKGNYKVSSIEVDTTDRNAPKLVAELIVSGKSVWRIAVAGKPVRLSATQALGRQLTQGFKDILGLVRLSPGNWF